MLKNLPKGLVDAVKLIIETTVPVQTRHVQQFDEELKGNQHKIDVNNNGKIDAGDFKLLRRKKAVKEALESGVDASDIVQFHSPMHSDLHEEIAVVVHRDARDGTIHVMSEGMKYKLKKDQVKEVSEELLGESTYEFDISGEHGNAAVDELVKHANSKGIKAKVHTYDGPGGGNPVIHLSHKDPKVVHAYAKKHIDPDVDLSDHKINEEVEQVDELSKKTLAKYIPAAAKDAERAGAHQEYFGSDQDFRTGRNRQKGIERAVKKLAKEEVEQVDELSQNKLTDYRAAAKKQGTGIQNKMKIGGGDWSKDGSDTKTLSKRMAGYKMAGRKVNPGISASVGKAPRVAATEEVQIDELSKKTLASYVPKAANRMAQSHAGVVKARHDYDSAAAIDHATSSTPSNVRDAAKKIIRQDASKREIDNLKDVQKRHQGIERAASKLAKEELEIEEGMEFEFEDRGIATVVEITENRIILAFDEGVEEFNINDLDFNDLDEGLETQTIKHPVGQRPKGIGWTLKQAGEQTGKDHSLWQRKVQKVNEEVDLDEAHAGYKADSEKSKFNSGHRAKLMNPEGKVSYLSGKSYKTPAHAKDAAKFYGSIMHLPIQTMDSKMNQYNKSYDAKHGDVKEEVEIDEARGRPPKAPKEGQKPSPAWQRHLERQKKGEDKEEVPALGFQLRKAVSIGKEITFMNGEKKKVDPRHISLYDDHIAARKTTQDKDRFQTGAAESHDAFVTAVTAPVPKPHGGTSEIVKYR
jgi:hypothetical protein